MDSALHLIDSLLGLSQQPKDLTFLQTSLRGVITFFAALVMVRISDKRFLARHTAFDAILAFIMASMLARAVNGSAGFFPTLGCGFVLVALHKAIAYFGRISRTVSYLVKGKSELLIKDGRVDRRALVKNDITDDDLCEELRLNGNLSGPKEAKAAWLEKNGTVSVVK